MSFLFACPLKFYLQEPIPTGLQSTLSNMGPIFFNSSLYFFLLFLPFLSLFYLIPSPFVPSDVTMLARWKRLLVQGRWSPQVVLVQGSGTRRASSAHGGGTRRCKLAAGQGDSGWHAKGRRSVAWRASGVAVRQRLPLTGIERGLRLGLAMEEERDLVRKKKTRGSLVQKIGHRHYTGRGSSFVGILTKPIRTWAK